MIERIDNKIKDLKTEEKNDKKLARKIDRKKDGEMDGIKEGKDGRLKEDSKEADGRLMRLKRLLECIGGV